MEATAQALQASFLVTWKAAGWTAVGAGVLCASLLSGSAALARQPVTAQPGQTADEEEEEGKTEFALVPFFGGNSDLGIGGGFIGSLARLRADRQPYLYHLEASGSMTFLGGGDASLRVPYADFGVVLNLPHLVPHRLGLETRMSYTRETNLKYYGLGNAASLPAGADRGSDYYVHTRVHPTVSVRWKYELEQFIALTAGLSYTENWFQVPANTLLAADLQNPNAYVRGLLGTAQAHGAPELSLGAEWDTRDDEASPSRGAYVTEQLDLTPGTFGDVSYSFARWDTSARAYVPLIPEQHRLIFAARVTSDLLFGHPPFYELPRFENTFAIGGSKGVRGVPAQRYYGKIKLLGNFELRSQLLEMRVLGTDRRLGIVAFADTGRLWADYRANPALDGSGLGLKYGVGGGLRIASGKAFVLRVDVAWSPDGVGGYLLSGQMF